MTEPQAHPSRLLDQPSIPEKIVGEAPPVRPPARARHRSGLRPFAPDPPLEAREALFDRVRIKVQGSVIAASDDALRQFTRQIGDNDRRSRSRLFGEGQWSGNRFTAPVVKDTTLGSGTVAVLAAGSGARIDIDVSVNPMRTLGHLLDRVRPDEFTSLAPREFFAVQPKPAASARSLDGNDNMVSDFRRLGGTVDEARLRANAAFLSAYEGQMRVLLIEALCPRFDGFDYDLDGDNVVATKGSTIVRLDWSRLTVSQCEVCWERAKTDPVATVADLGDAIMSGARALSLRRDGLHQGRDGGAVTIKVPLIPSGAIELAIYAKDADRIRVEVRYKSRIPQPVRAQVRRSGQGRLSAWFDAFRADALPRVPWCELHNLEAVGLPLSTDHILDLVEAVGVRVDDDPRSRRHILEALLSTGGVSATGTTGLAPVAVLNSLAKAGYVQHERLITKDSVIGRRYAVTRRPR